MAKYKVVFRLVIVTLFLTGIVHSLSSQRYFTQIYTEADGLSSNMVYDATQDTSGLIWFATRSGVSSYDGKTWTTYPVDSRLQSFSFAFIVSDEKGALWTIPHHKEPVVYRYSGTGWSPFTVDSVHPVRAYYMAFDVSYENGEPIFALGSNDKGLFVYRHHRWMHYTTKEGLVSDQIRDVKWIGTRLFIATDKGISVLQDDRISNRLNKLLPPDHREILAIGKKRDPGSDTSAFHLWVLGDRWLGELSGHSFSVRISGFPVSSYNLMTRCFIYPLADGRLYFGNPFYLYYWNPNSTAPPETIDRNNGLIASGATAVLEDREFNTWITGYRGITKIPSRRFTTYTANEGLFDNEVSSALEISKGHMVFGHHGALTFFRNNAFESFSLRSDPTRGLPEIRVQDMDMDADGNLWLAASTLGIASITPQKTITWYRPGIHENWASVVVLRDGRIFASCDKSLYRFSKPMNRFDPFFIRIVKNQGIRKLFPGKDSSLVCATYSSGLLVIRGDTETLIRSFSHELANNVYGYLEDHQGTKWVGTVIGLFKVSGTELVKVDSSGLRIDRPVYLILEDPDGRLWFGTDNGIFRWNGDKLDHFTRSDGISGQEINRDAGFVDAEGDIWFGTNFGLTRYHPEYGYSRMTIPSPLVKLEWMEVNGDTLSCQQPVTLSSSENNLSFSFHAISFIQEEKTVYSVKLKGFDSDWSTPFQSRNAEYRYNNLLPGRYTFCLKARNAIGIWSEPVCSATIHIRPPFYFRWWFLLLAGLGLAGLFVVGARFALTWRYNLKLEKMVAIKTRALRRSEKMLQESNAAKDSFFSIIAHDLKSPFNAILGMLELLTTEYHEFSDEERHRILMNLRNSSTRTINLLENLLTWSQAQKGILPYEPVKFDLMELVAENLSLFESAARAKNITILPPPRDIHLVFADRNMINTVIRNLISNAIKFTYDGGKVTLLCIKDHEHEVTFSVSDTGQGMDEKMVKNLFQLDRRTTAKGTNNETGTGLGLILSRDFVVKNNGRIWVTSEPGNGSTFWFTIPTMSM